MQPPLASPGSSRRKLFAQSFRAGISHTTLTSPAEQKGGASMSRPSQRKRLGWIEGNLRKSTPLLRYLSGDNNGDAEGQTCFDKFLGLLLELTRKLIKEAQKGRVKSSKTTNASVAYAI